MALLPGSPVPALSLPTVSGTDWSMSSQDSGAFTMLVFYRGYHCPKCKEQLLELQEHLSDFEAEGVSIVAISMDGADRAERARDEWGLQRMNIAHSLSEAQAREWGMMISSSRGMTSSGVEETARFNEPGLYIVRADGTLYAQWVQSAPFGRPKAQDLLGMIRFVKEKDYPPRGTVAA